MLRCPCSTAPIRAPCSPWRARRISTAHCSSCAASPGAPSRLSRSITTLPPAPVKRLADWIEQLVAESTGKGGRGVVPVVDDPLPTPSPDSQIVSEFSADPRSLGTEFVAWEYATEELCARLGVNAFDQPDV